MSTSSRQSNVRKFSVEWGVWIGVLVVLALAYLGAYLYLTWDPRSNTAFIALEFDMRDVHGLPDPLFFGTPQYAENRQLNSLLRTLFAPAHSLDQRIFPRRWTMDPSRWDTPLGTGAAPPPPALPMPPALLVHREERQLETQNAN